MVTKQENSWKVELDHIVLDIELVTISIIQGVALTFLIENSAKLIENHAIYNFLYVASGFAIILIFWSEAIIHALSFIDWPLDLGHNFLYFLTSFIEVIAFTQVMNPENWFLVLVLFFIVGGLLYFYDLFLIKRHKESFSRTSRGRELFEHIKKRQIWELRILIPLGTIYNICAFVLISFLPHVFLDNHWHVLLGAMQAFFSVLLLFNSSALFRKRILLISEFRKEDKK